MGAFQEKLLADIARNPQPAPQHVESDVPQRGLSTSANMGEQLTVVSKERELREQAEAKLASLQSQEHANGQKCQVVRRQWQDRLADCRVSAGAKVAGTALLVFVGGYLLFGRRSSPPKETRTTS